ncbi:hypothetical protein [Burkholderia multivorans]|uniref:hypothetical protein n=1 Tax=Burkholderia multivorans TaxID=87883 RepID=UPI0004F870D6|nr:hypothetical protein [Burkholderia multivorans]AIO72714.1 hypothetical protein DM80_5337 [Burkholderia multivorans]AOK65250.1 hypothetical protein WM33_06660 [Burkholderia multivorans]KVZ84143.1 hypothetical protein WL23_00470 [Burkholderia multivorans]KWF70666.1 hypothetical protein WL91_11635 [Burkholderia multivorans]KWF79928.1 hypothetical protein WL92_12485 [Burkholderia multivorans]
MPKYEIAWYLDENQQWQEASFRELSREERRAALRERDLRDKANGSIELGIRNHPKTPHFFERRRIRTDIEPGAHESQAHEDAKRMIRSFLQKYDKHRFGYYERPWDRNDKGFETLIKIKDYMWDVEVQFGLAYGKYIRFDILGRSKSLVQLTDRLPFLAIEIVDTHFHSRETFEVLLQVSKNLPLTVAYYFIPAVPIYNCVNRPPTASAYCRIRLQCYLSDGSFWFRNERVEESFDVTPDEPGAYYNLIREKLYSDGYIRKESAA